MGNEGAKRRRVLRMQKYLLNPPIKLAVRGGLVPGYVLLETVGRTTGRRRTTVVGVRLSGRDLWLVSEQGRYSDYVRNIEAEPRVRVWLGRRWRDGSAEVVDADDPLERLESFGWSSHARAVTTMGTSLLTVRIRLDD